jgi:pimeloyl-ACP methyl ester carboxylesterase
MPTCRSKEVEIDYDVQGPADGPPLVLVMGLGVSLVFWEEGFCRLLAERGFRVIRLDNRDVGRSTKLDGLGMPNVMEAMTAMMMRQPIVAPYLLSDMASDVVALLDELEIERAHLVGASMGGMIVQTVAIEHPERVLSLTSIMSSTGDPTLPPGKPEAMQLLMAPPSPDRTAYLEQSKLVWRTIGSPGFPFDETRVLARAGEHYDRGYHPPGVARQLVAILASGDRTAKLSAVKAPTLVIHGTDDPLVPVEAGKATASAIPGAKLMLIEGMGHDMPPETWAEITEGIVKIAAAT